jgi:monofunctional chorismate mutase
LGVYLVVCGNGSKSAAFGGLKGKYTTFDGSLLDFMLLETEKLHALTRRYTSPDENAFFPHLLPEPILPIIDFPRVLNPNRININNQIMSVYQEKILPGLTTLASDDTAVRQHPSFRVRIGVC